MKSIEHITKEKTPIVAVDKNLDKLRDTIKFPKKLSQANELLLNVKLPPRKNVSGLHQ